MSNYPPGVTAAHPHFNPPVCPKCEDEFDGEKCECGFEVEDDHGDRDYDAMKDREAERWADA